MCLFLNVMRWNITVLTRHFSKLLVSQRDATCLVCDGAFLSRESQYVVVNKWKQIWDLSPRWIEEAKKGRERKRLHTLTHYETAPRLQWLIDQPLALCVCWRRRGGWWIDILLAAVMLIQGREPWGCFLQGPVTLLFHVISSPPVWGPGCQPLPKVTQTPGPLLQIIGLFRIVASTYCPVWGQKWI